MRRFLGASLLVVFAAVNAWGWGQESWGTWTDGTSTYAFIPNNTFKFTGRFATITTPYLTGVWETGRELCSLGSETGDLMIFVESTQCCMQKRFLGAKLVLSKVWEKGDSPRRPNIYDDLCETGLLDRVK